MIKSDKKVVEGSYRIKDYKIEVIEIGDSSAHLVSYKFYNENKEAFVAKEYYKKENGSIVKMCFYTSEDRYKDNMLIAFQTILESFRIE